MATRAVCILSIAVFAASQDNSCSRRCGTIGCLRLPEGPNAINFVQPGSLYPYNVPYNPGMYQPRPPTPFPYPPMYPMYGPMYPMYPRPIYREAPTGGEKQWTGRRMQVGTKQYFFGPPPPPMMGFPPPMYPWGPPPPMYPPPLYPSYPPPPPTSVVVSEKIGCTQGQDCSCDNLCEEQGDCCSDYDSLCIGVSKSPTSPTTRMPTTKMPTRETRGATSGDFWTIRHQGGGRCRSDSPHDLRDKTLRATVALDQVWGHVTATLYLVSPEEGSYYYCDAQGEQGPYCMEIDLMETNGYYTAAANIHTMNPGRWQSPGCGGPDSGGLACVCDSGGFCETVVKFKAASNVNCDESSFRPRQDVCPSGCADFIDAQKIFNVEIRFNSVGEVEYIEYTQDSDVVQSEGATILLYPAALEAPNPSRGYPFAGDGEAMRQATSNPRRWYIVTSLWQGSWQGPGNCNNDWGSLSDSVYFVGGISITDNNNGGGIIMGAFTGECW